jgi:alkylated DNA repair dioxygenase AlkB
VVTTHRDPWPGREALASQALTPGLDLRRALADTVATGAAFVPAALHEPFRARLLEEVERGPFVPMSEQAGSKGVRQQGERFAVGGDMRAHPFVHALREALVQGVRRHAALGAGLADWLPNDASVQRYRPGALGITPHLDGRRFRYLVAVVTVDGTAAFSLCADRSGTVLRRWDTVAGSLLLMRGPGLAGCADCRPLHTVAGPERHPRTSLTLRMDGGTG